MEYKNIGAFFYTLKKYNNIKKEDISKNYKHGDSGQDVVMKIVALDGVEYHCSVINKNCDVCVFSLLSNKKPYCQTGIADKSYYNLCNCKDKLSMWWALNERRELLNKLAVRLRGIKTEPAT